MAPSMSAEEMNVCSAVIFATSSVLYRLYLIRQQRESEYENEYKHKIGIGNGNGNGYGQQQTSSSRFVYPLDDVDDDGGGDADSIEQSRLRQHRQQQHQYRLQRERNRLSVGCFEEANMTPLSSFTSYNRSATNGDGDGSDPNTVTNATSYAAATAHARFEHHFDFNRDSTSSENYQCINFSNRGERRRNWRRMNGVDIDSSSGGQNNNIHCDDGNVMKSPEDDENKDDKKSIAMASSRSLSSDGDNSNSNSNSSSKRERLQSMQPYDKFDDLRERSDSGNENDQYYHTASSIGSRRNLERKARKKNASFLSNLFSFKAGVRSNSPVHDDSNHNDDQNNNNNDDSNNNGHELLKSSPTHENYIDFHLGSPTEDAYYAQHSTMNLAHTFTNNYNYNTYQAKNEIKNQPHDDSLHHQSPSISSSYKKERANYNSKIMPRRLIFVRHGQSEGNVNETLYEHCPDSNIRLTKLGWDQAKMAGRALREEILKQQPKNNDTNGSRNSSSNSSSNKSSSSKTPSVHFIVSPYVRTMETFHGLASAWCDPKDFAHIEDDKVRLRLWYEELAQLGVTFNEDPRIREQDFGNYQNREAINKAKKERHKFGPFYYRFPNGESASDVYDRISTFFDSLWRSFSSNKSTNYVLVTHGISIRVLLARYFRYSVDQFQTMANPNNCEMIILGHDGYGRLELEGRCELKMRKIETEGEETSESDNNVKVSGYHFFKKLKVIPKCYMRTRNIRIDCS